MMTIDEALSTIIYRENLHEKLNIPEETVRTWRNRFKKGKLPDPKKKEILKKAGMVIVQPEMWGYADGVSAYHKGNLLIIKKNKAGKDE